MENYFRTYLKSFSENPVKVWNYEAGITLKGAQALFEASGDDYYYTCLKKNMDHYILHDGSIRYLDLKERNLDRFHTGKMLYFFYEKTGEERFRQAIEILMDMLRVHPRTSTGNFWHKEIYPWQIWLDGLYMALPFYMEYENRFDHLEHYDDIFSQMVHVREILYDPDKKLYYHAYDEKKVQPWADPDTGLSHNFWLRSIGWHLMALIDLYELCVSEKAEQKKQYADWFKEALEGVMLYQDPDSALFYQLIALPEEPGNYLETSGSAMISYAILKACRLGVLDAESYRSKGIKILENIAQQKLMEENGVWHLKDICQVAGLGPGNARDGSIAYYLSEPIVSDDVKGVGAAMMAYAEYLRIK